MVNEKFKKKVLDKLVDLSTEAEVIDSWDFGNDGWEYEFKDGSRLYVNLQKTREACK